MTQSEDYIDHFEVNWGRFEVNFLKVLVNNLTWCLRELVIVTKLDKNKVILCEGFLRPESSSRLGK